jgi:AcrR family transcriptional regulator
MPRTSDKRERLVDAAMTLFHHRGFGQTSLSDIAEQSGVPLGNVYYYFKTKDDLANAVIHERIRDMNGMFQMCEIKDDPKASLYCFLDFLIDHRTDISKYGCPIGGLCQELNKDDSELANKADELLNQGLEWITRQFKLMQRKDAAELAQHLLANTHGASLLANTFSKPEIVKQEAENTKAWIESL